MTWGIAVFSQKRCLSAANTLTLETQCADLMMLLTRGGSARRVQPAIRPAFDAANGTSRHQPHLIAVVVHGIVQRDISYAFALDRHEEHAVGQRLDSEITRRRDRLAEAVRQRLAVMRSADMMAV